MTELMVCKKCGNTDSFIRTEYCTQSVTNFNKYNKKGKFLDTLDTEYGDSDTTDYDPFQCHECESEHILTASIEEWIDYISKHTDDDDEWNSEELPKPNLKIKRKLQAEYMLGEKND